jgi:hypothetical protein
MHVLLFYPLLSLGITFLGKQLRSGFLPSDAKALYSSATKKQLKDRLSTKLGKILLTPADKIANILIRYNFQ